MEDIESIGLGSNDRPREFRIVTYFYLIIIATSYAYPYPYPYPYLDLLDFMTYIF